jgi:hypothetical protein
MQRRTLLSTLLTSLLATQALLARAENETRQFAALSLIGGKFNLVIFQGGTGSHLENNSRQSVSLPGNPFDGVALGAIQDAVQRVAGSQEVLFYTTPRQELFDKPAALFDGARVLLPPNLLAAMKKDGASHLLLVTNFRQKAAMETRDRLVGSGYLEGVGYYIDHQQRTKRLDTLEEGTGFLASYVYLQLSLIDLKSHSVVQQRSIKASTVLSAAQNKAGFEPWEVLSPNEKVEKLNATITRELDRAVTELIRPR